MQRGEVSWVEWPTLALIMATHGAWILSVFALSNISILATIIVLAVVIALYSSLQHEVIHGHPTRVQWLNQAMVAPAYSLAIPYLRFRDTHLAHHMDSVLTDPFDDPESNYVDEGNWLRWPAALRAILRFNNTLAGRLLIGPIIAQVFFMRSDWQSIRARDRHVLSGWLWHGLAAVLTLSVVALSSLPIWAYLIACYGGISLLKIRTFAEHQAHEKVRGRTVIIEDRGPLSVLFLNNNLHVVHHMHPKLPWYRLPHQYRALKDRYLRANDSYVFPGYGAVFRAYLFKAKDPVPHPLWRRVP